MRVTSSVLSTALTALAITPSVIAAPFDGLPTNIDTTVDLPPLRQSFGQQLNPAPARPQSPSHHEYEGFEAPKSPSSSEHEHAVPSHHQSFHSKVYTRPSHTPQQMRQNVRRQQLLARNARAYAYPGLGSKLGKAANIASDVAMLAPLAAGPEMLPAVGAEFAAKSALKTGVKDAARQGMKAAAQSGPPPQRQGQGRKQKRDARFSLSGFGHAVEHHAPQVLNTAAQLAPLLPQFQQQQQYQQYAQQPMRRSAAPEPRFSLSGFGHAVEHHAPQVLNTAAQLAPLLPQFQQQQQYQQYPQQPMRRSAAPEPRFSFKGVEHAVEKHAPQVLNAAAQLAPLLQQQQYPQQQYGQQWKREAEADAEADAEAEAEARFSLGGFGHAVEKHAPAVLNTAAQLAPLLQQLQYQQQYPQQQQQQQPWKRDAYPAAYPDVDMYIRDVIDSMYD